jgi:hypothetical protein
MKNVKLIIAIMLLAIGHSSYSQTSEITQNTKLIAVVNKATWCAACKANGDRFGVLLFTYASKGVTIYVNDLSNEKTKEASKQELEKANVYEAVYTTPRKGMGKALKACGMVKDKKQTTDVAGIVTFIDAKSHKQVKQISISETDDEMKKTINKLLN